MSVKQRFSLGAGLRLIERLRLRNRPGQSLALLAVSMTGLLGLLALGIDLGMLFVARGEAQRVADAAALAGASVFEEEGAQDLSDAALQAMVHERVHTYGGLNTVRNDNVEPEEMAIEILRQRGLVRVTVRRTEIPLWFARLLGHNLASVAASAAAAVEYSGSVQCLRPIAFADLWQEQAGSPDRFTLGGPGERSCLLGSGICDYYRDVDTGRGMWWRNAGRTGYEAPTKQDDVGRRLTFDLNRHTVRENDTERLHRFSYYPLRIPGCNGGDCWRDGLARPCAHGPNRASIHDDVITEPGVQVGPTDQGMREAYNADPDAYWDDAADVIRGSRYPLGCTGSGCTGEGSPRIFNVAMVHPSSAISASASGTFRIENLAAFFLESWQAGGQVNQFTVRWMKPTPLRDSCWQRNLCRSNLRFPLRLVE